MATRNHSPFDGFEVPEQNWFRLPNSWTDVTAQITSLAELKVIEYVLRHTWGYQEYGIVKRISIDEFMEGRKRADGTRMDSGTGLSNKSVIKGTRRAVEDGLLIEEVDDSDRGRIKKYYSVRMKNGNTPMKKVHTRGEDATHAHVNTPQGTEKDTSRKHSEETLLGTTTGVVATLVGYGIVEQKATEIEERFMEPYIAGKIEFMRWKIETEFGKPIEDIPSWLIASQEGVHRFIETEEAK